MIVFDMRVTRAANGTHDWFVDFDTVSANHSGNAPTLKAAMAEVGRVRTQMAGVVTEGVE